MSDEALAARMEAEHYKRERELEAERCECGIVSRGLVDGVCANCRATVNVVEPDADNAKCMVRGHDYVPENVSATDRDRECPICVRCSSPKPGIKVWVHGFVKAYPPNTRWGTASLDVLLVEDTTVTHEARFALYLDGEPVGLGPMSHYRDGGTRAWDTQTHGRLQLSRRIRQPPTDWLDGLKITPHANHG